MVTDHLTEARAAYDEFTAALAEALLPETPSEREDELETQGIQAGIRFVASWGLGVLEELRGIRTALEERNA